MSMRKMRLSTIILAALAVLDLNSGRGYCTSPCSYLSSYVPWSKHSQARLKDHRGRAMHRYYGVHIGPTCTLAYGHEYQIRCLWD